jgi:FkbM family methyltransferase
MNQKTAQTINLPTSFISYAQNFEDIMLWRALKHIKSGFYIDIGAQDPHNDSVSRGFYEKGWRGVHIEPTPEYARKLRADRPDELVYEVALGDQEGEILFYVSSDSGVSTALEQNAEANKRLGLSVEPIMVLGKRLATISKAFDCKTVHWMKIDVEGMEEQVLKGWDPLLLRPWIILVEATIPNSRIVNSEKWEYLLREANYEFVYFDGLNSFYVASERKELKASFCSPVNIFDAIEGCRLNRSNLFLSEVEAELLSERTALLSERTARQADQKKIADIQARVAWFEKSTSWRITKPLRDLLTHLRRSARLVFSKSAGKVSPVLASNETTNKKSVTQFPASAPGLISLEVDREPKIYLQSSRPDPTTLAFPGFVGTSPCSVLTSGFCVSEQLRSPAFRHWLSILGLEWRLHRKLWEFGFVIQALYERGCLDSECRGLGFAVGEEPLPALFASMGCEITATDLDSTDARADVWAQTAQLATDLSKLRKPEICPDLIFDRKVAFKPVDMNRIPGDLINFDFTWSTCSFEHCGSIELGSQFIENQLQCLRPGGIAVHTTEFNLSSLDDTITEGPTVIFRRKDIEAIIKRLQVSGHHVEPLCPFLGGAEIDRAIDLMPYSENRHLKLLLFDKYISTSVALIIKKGQA